MTAEKLLPEVELVTTVVEVVGGKRPTVVAVTVLVEFETGCKEILGGDAGVTPLLLEGDRIVDFKVFLS